MHKLPYNMKVITSVVKECDKLKLTKVVINPNLCIIKEVGDPYKINSLWYVNIEYEHTECFCLMSGKICFESKEDALGLKIGYSWELNYAKKNKNSKNKNLERIRRRRKS